MLKDKLARGSALLESFLICLWIILLCYLQLMQKAKDESLRKGYRQPPTVLGKVLLIGVMPVILENTLC